MGTKLLKHAPELQRRILVAGLRKRLKAATDPAERQAITRVLDLYKAGPRASFYATGCQN